MPLQFVAQGPMQLPAAGGADTAQALAFVARLDGSQNATHTTAYKTLINGLVNDSSGVWACLDALYVFATNDTTNSLLNLVSTSFNASATGTPTFTTDQGYTGLSGVDFIDSTFTPSTAGGLYAANDAHFSIWNNTNIHSPLALGFSLDSTSHTSIFCFDGDDNVYGRINDPAAGESTGTAPAGGEFRGLIVATRTGLSTQKLYKYTNSGLEDLSPTPPVTSAGLPTQTIRFVENPVHHQLAGSIGKQLSSSQATALGSWLRGYMVTIAGISY